MKVRDYERGHEREGHDEKKRWGDHEKEKGHKKEKREVMKNKDPEREVTEKRP
jgi:hypothetical protein